jgi:hypothetical protein
VRLDGGKNYMQICSYTYFQDMQGLDVTLKAKLFLCIPLRHMGTGCSAKGKVVPVHTIQAHGDWT